MWLILNVVNYIKLFYTRMTERKKHKKQLTNYEHYEHEWYDMNMIMFRIYNLTFYGLMISQNDYQEGNLV